ncbi:MAG TPA: hypothetical protein VLY21_00155 [Nitrososphaerales archaeon]|nr:hypothetical protein [Nitrososphaerales archaeon]
MVSLLYLAVYLVGLVIAWVIISIPAYIAAKAVTGGRATFGGAMGATLGGALVYAIVLLGVGFFLGAVIGASAWIFAVLLAFIAWIAVYRAAFDVGWFSAFAIAILSLIILLVLQVLLVALLGVHLPTFLKFPF